MKPTLNRRAFLGLTAGAVASTLVEPARVSAALAADGGGGALVPFTVREQMLYSGLKRL